MKKILIVCEFGCEYELAEKVVVLQPQNAQRIIAELGMFPDFESLEKYFFYFHFFYIENTYQNDTLTNTYISN